MKVEGALQFVFIALLVLAMAAQNAFALAPVPSSGNGKNKGKFAVFKPSDNGDPKAGLLSNEDPWAEKKPKLVPTDGNEFVWSENPKKEVVDKLPEKRVVLGSGHVDFTQMLFTSADNPVESTVGDISSYKTGYATLGGACAEVQRGAEIKMVYDITVEAVTAREVFDSTKSFRSSLNTSEQHVYDKEVQDYKGGLTIPCLSWLGLDFSASYNKEKVRESRDSHKDYDELAKQASDLMKTNTNQKLHIKGSLTATGYSRFPTKACATVEVTHVTYKDGTKQSIVSTDSGDLAARDSKGNKVPTTDKEIGF